MATTTTKPIKAHDVGPIADFEFTPPPAGVVVMKGPSGVGKSILLDAIEAASGGKGKPPVSDGAERAEVRLGEVVLKVGKSARRSGELEYNVLDGRYTIADLISPPYKDVSARDRHAIKTVAQLAGSGDEALFYKLVGGKAEFETLCPSNEVGSLDVVQLAGKIERGLQARARQEESKADAADGKADALGAGSRDIDTDVEHNATSLAVTRDRAVSHLAGLEQKANDSRQRLEAASAAQDALEDAEAETTGASVAEAGEYLRRMQSESDEQKNQVDFLTRQLNDAEQLLNAKRATVDRAQAMLESAKNTAQALDKFRAIVAAAKDVQPVPDEAISAARQALATAREAEQTGTLVRKALEDRQQSDAFRHKAAEYRQAAEKLRGAAAGTDDVLSDMVGKLDSPLFVKRGRLVIKSDRGVESFWELSDGERSEIAVTVFAAAARRQATDPSQSCLLALPQSFWEGLDWQGRKRIAELMVRLNVLAFTAESDKQESAAGPLRAEVYEP